MRSLIDFLYRHNHWLVFLLLEGISLALLFTYNKYQNNIWLSSANVVTGRLFEVEQNVQSFFSLRSDNKNLAEQNARLEEKIFRLEQLIDSVQRDSLVAVSTMKRAINVTPATVVSNSINRTDNYITINKGTDDGIAPDMGVIGSQGIVGVTYKCSRHYTLVIPILNSKSSISCKVMPSESFGYLQWNGGDSRIARLCDVPRYAKVSVGDTIVTTGSSTFFPEGLPVGTISSFDPLSDNLSNLIDVELYTKFSTLRHVFVINDPDTAEQRELQEAETEKKK
ncbi:MAG: rod shape-determining protein MreC [Bacteroidaceae bacterium]|nr:rod shape-determining protein MreC [Bacteroidaceae bacterium]MBO4589605.1 rod shape-determining protein MreC [Bacteroidaceae bacterium]MBR5964137.1 rod shape-determining protein MreC [Bacteroidaceae bacterium]